MIKFSQEKVLLLHKLIIEETGGDPNVRDIALLDSALESAFANNATIKEVEFGSNINYISKNAFKNCAELSTLTFKSKDIEIESGAFDGSVVSNVHSLIDNGIVFESGIIYNSDITKIIYVFDTATEIVLPKTVLSVGTAFRGNDNIKSIKFSDDSAITYIDSYAFSECHNLESAYIGNNITTIGEQAFHDCSSLKTVTFGENLKSIGYGSFAFCYNLENIVLNDSVEYIGKGAF